MGFGDNLMATGLARGAASRGKHVALGDGKKIIWDHHSLSIFQSNPNLAFPGQETRPDVEWINHYKGHRLYNKQSEGRWEWNYDFSPTPGEMFFSDQELHHAQRGGRNFVLVEPNLPRWKAVSYNKEWGFYRYQTLVALLKKHELKVVQFVYGNEPVVPGAIGMKTSSFRDAVSVMAHAALYVGPEGGLHHAAAAVGIPAVVLFGGFVPPSVTGYATHVNLTGGAEACGSLHKCDHCRAAMAAISVEEVVTAVINIVNNKGKIV